MRGPSPLSLVGEDFEPAAARREVGHQLFEMTQVTFFNFRFACSKRLPSNPSPLSLVGEDFEPAAGREVGHHY